MDVRLERHTAIQQTSLGPIEVEFVEDRVFVYGRLAGYCSLRDALVKLFAVNVPQKMKDEISQKVAELRGLPASPVIQAPVLPSEDETEFEDE